jgi:Glycosyltransferase family 87
MAASSHFDIAALDLRYIGLMSRRTMFILPGVIALAVLVFWWVARAYNEAAPADLGLAYEGGTAAWATGHPEHLITWISTPFLGAVMAVVSQVVSIGTAADLITTLNLVLVVGTVVFVLYRLRGVLPTFGWWVVALAMLSFGPMLSTVWWKQFNLIALVGASAGFYLIRERREASGAALIGLSIAVKPLAILLPFVLLARRETRRAGAMALGWLIGINILAQGFMAERAGNLTTLNVLPILKDFSDRSKPANIWACHTENFAPGSLLCRLAGGQNWNVQHVIVWAAVALLGAWVIDALRGRKMISWEVFCFSCAISTMVSPIAWSHYQVMLAPLFLLLFVRFVTDGASFACWAGLVLAFVLASLMWQPFGTSVGAVRHLIDGSAQTQRALFSIASVAEFAQYVLVLTGIIWYLQARAATASATSKVKEVIA